MAAPSSSSCEVVDLGLAASSDDATSQLFFSKGGHGDLSWPAAAGVRSALTNQKSLVAPCDKYGVPREFKPVRADALRCGVCETPPKGSNALCIYSDALEAAGLRFPLHDFYLKLLRHYRLAPSQLAPNAWKYMAAFALRCKDAGVQPLVSAFRYFFSLYAHKHGDKALGWHHFQPCAGRPRLFYGALPTRYDWKTRFFFLKSEAKLRETEAMSDKFLDYLYNKRTENDLLKEKHARLIEEQAAVVARMKAERAAEVAKLQEEHASAVAQLTKRLNDEHAASIAELNEEHAADLARVKDAAEKKVQDVMKNVVRILYPEADLSQLEDPKRKGDLAAAGTPEAEGRSATS